MSPEPTVEQLIAAARARATSDDELALLDAVIAVTTPTKPSTRSYARSAPPDTPGP
jgi:hypothetical protein